VREAQGVAEGEGEGGGACVSMLVLVCLCESESESVLAYHISSSTHLRNKLPPHTHRPLTKRYKSVVAKEGRSVATYYSTQPVMKLYCVWLCAMRIVSVGRVFHTHAHAQKKQKQRTPGL
jgi:hypothetical protein